MSRRKRRRSILVIVPIGIDARMQGLWFEMRVHVLGFGVDLIRKANRDFIERLE